MRWVVFLLALMISCDLAAAQMNVTVSGGYSHTNIANHSSLELNRDGGYVDTDVAFVVAHVPTPILIGGGLGFSDFYRDENVNAPITGGGSALATLDSDFDMVQLEARVAAPILFGVDRGFFIEPRLGAGLLIDNYSIDNVNPNNGNPFFFTEYHDGVGVEIHPALQFGYDFGGASVGVEGSYIVGIGDMGRLGSAFTELRVGAFVTVHF